jgi:hypothetical protein
LAEVVGQYSKQFVETYTAEFAERSQSLTNDELTAWATPTGHELCFTLGTPKKARQWADEIIAKCATCDTVRRSRLEKFNKRAIAAMADYGEDCD